MKKLTILGISAAGICMALGFILISSFTVITNYSDEFLKQLGISKTDADTRIFNSMLDGSLDEYGLSKAKNIALGNRAAVTRDLLVYVKKKVASPGFIQEYNTLRERKKPTLTTTKAPEEFHKDHIADNKKSLAELEANAKKNTMESMKPVYEKMIADAQKRLKEAEDPNGKVMKSYRQRYAENERMGRESNERKMNDWESKYPANPLHFIKMRLEQFMQESADIDFDAETYSKGGIKYFTNRAYESKSNRWKMGFRAGREAVMTARTFATQWIAEIK